MDLDTIHRTMRTTAFGRQTGVEAHPDRPGHYHSVLTDQWCAPVLPHGGIVTALALRAMAAELGAPDERLRSVTTVFAAQVPPGPVDIDVTVLRRGRTMSQAIATVRPEGATSGHTAIAVFGVARPGFEFTDVTYPEVPPPEECPSFRDPLPEGVIGFVPASFWERVESRPAVGHAPWDQWEPTTSERVYWYRFDDPPVDDDGVWDPFALVALCDTMPARWESAWARSRPRGTGPVPISPCTFSERRRRRGCSATTAPATPARGTRRSRWSCGTRSTASSPTARR